MTNLTIPITEDRLEMLNEYASSLGIPADALVRAAIDQLLARRHDEEFEKRAQRLTEKNAELYRRLA